MKKSFLFSGLILCGVSSYSYSYLAGHDSRVDSAMEYKLNRVDPGDSLIAKGAKPELVSNQFSFTEGPAVDKKGNIFFTDQPNDKIWKWNAADGKLSLFMNNTGRSNGLYFDTKGNLVACAD